MGEGALGAFWRMYETLILVCGGFLITFGLYFMSQNVLKALEEISGNLNRETTHDFPDIQSIKDDLLEIVEDTIQNMQPPSAIDHLMGALAQFAQIKLMKAAGIDDLQSLMPQGLEFEEDIVS